MSLGNKNRLLAVFAVITLILGGVVGFVGLTPSHAAPNPGIKVKPSGLVRFDPSGKVLEGPIPLNETGLLSFEWDARGVDIKSGDSFSVNFGEHFSTRVPGVSFPLKVSGKVVGTCVTGADDFVCTFNDEIESVLALHPEGVFGKGKMHINADKETDADHVDMNFNGTVLPVTLPGGGGIVAPPKPPFTPTKFVKFSTGMSEKSTAGNWYIGFSIDELNKVRVEQGLQPIPTDGNPATIVLEDSVGPKQKFRSSGEGVEASLAVKKIDGSTVVLSQIDKNRPVETPGWSLEVEKNAPATYAKVTISGAFESGVNYQLYLPANITDLPAQPGYEYSNSVKVEGMDLSSENSRSFAESFAIDIEMVQNYGLFNVMKSLGGNASGLVPNDTTYRVIAKYRFPDNKTADDYQTNGGPYRYPGTLDADKMGGSVVLELSPGKKGYPKGQLPGETDPVIALLPVGTTVTLEEDVTALPAINGLEWQTPEFKVENKVANTLVIKNQADENVTLTNRAIFTTKQFSIKKVVEGIPAGGANQPFFFKYVCDSGTTGRVQVMADGVAHLVDAHVPASDRCVISEEAEKTVIPGYALVSVPSPIALDMTDANPVADFTNVYTPGAQVSVTKTVEGINEGEILGKAFPFTLECTSGADKFTEKGQVTLGGKWTSKVLPVGSNCTVTEDMAVAQVPGYNLASQPVQVTLAAGTPVAEVAMHNVYKQKVGNIQVTKIANGFETDAERDAKEFPVTVSCLLHDDQTLMLKHGQPQTVTGIPEGDICTISENKAAIEVPGYSLADPVIDQPKITVVEGQDHQVTVTNTYTRNPGSLAIKKVLEVPAGAAFANDTFTINYTCDADGFRDKTVTLANNAQEVINGIPHGTVCTISEVAPDFDGHNK
ncbi:DUF5979 domain-containing protein, partial [Gleimia sp. 6138-11-ORH1]|uniref:DUF5979 domain-containing protein n=1 Tax=Gleimia sp. 6138-11-ORH1 TaxID=2973937 RepID=UPI002167F8FD